MTVRCWWSSIVPHYLSSLARQVIFTTNCWSSLARLLLTRRYYISSAITLWARWYVGISKPWNSQPIKICQFLEIMFCLVFTETLLLELGVTQGRFKRGTSGLNSKFSFSKIGCNIKVKVMSLLNYLFIAGRKNNLIYSFPKGLSAK